MLNLQNIIRIVSFIVFLVLSLFCLRQFWRRGYVISHVCQSVFLSVRLYVSMQNYTNNRVWILTEMKEHYKDIVK